MCQSTSALVHVKLHSVDPARNRRRFYEIMETQTLFGELCLWIVWGRIGHRPSHEHTELFTDRAALVRRRDSLIARRRRHGYVSRTPIESTTDTPSVLPAESSALDSHAVEREIVEAHGLSPDDSTARTLVMRWHAATRDIASYLEAHGVHADLTDASTLAEMFVGATAA